jgi:hypothetical protein
VNEWEILKIHRKFSMGNLNGRDHLGDEGLNVAIRKEEDLKETL